MAASSSLSVSKESTERRKHVSSTRNTKTASLLSDVELRKRILECDPTETYNGVFEFFPVLFFPSASERTLSPRKHLDNVFRVLSLFKRELNFHLPKELSTPSVLTFLPFVPLFRYDFLTVRESKDTLSEIGIDDLHSKLSLIEVMFYLNYSLPDSTEENNAPRKTKKRKLYVDLGLLFNDLFLFDDKIPTGELHLPNSHSKHHISSLLCEETSSLKYSIVEQSNVRFINSFLELGSRQTISRQYQSKITDTYSKLLRELDSSQEYDSDGDESDQYEQYCTDDEECSSSSSSSSSTGTAICEAEVCDENSYSNLVCTVCILNASILIYICHISKRLGNHAQVFKGCTDEHAMIDCTLRESMAGLFFLHSSCRRERETHSNQRSVLRSLLNNITHVPRWQHLIDNTRPGVQRLHVLKVSSVESSAPDKHLPIVHFMLSLRKLCIYASETFDYKNIPIQAFSKHFLDRVFFQEEANGDSAPRKHLSSDGENTLTYNSLDDFYRQILENVTLRALNEMSGGDRQTSKSTLNKSLTNTALMTFRLLHERFYPGISWYQRSTKSLSRVKFMIVVHEMDKHSKSFEKYNPCAVIVPKLVEHSKGKDKVHTPLQSEFNK